MRVSVALRRLAVGRPTGVSDTDAALQRPVAQDALQVAELPEGLPHHDLALIEDGDAGGVVAPVFETPQAVEENVHGAMLAPDVADDSAHVW